VVLGVVGILVVVVVVLVPKPSENWPRTTKTNISRLMDAIVVRPLDLGLGLDESDNINVDIVENCLREVTLFWLFAVF